MNRSVRWYQPRGVRFWIGWTAAGLVYVIAGGITSLPPAATAAMAGGYCLLSAGIFGAYFRFIVGGSQGARLQRQIIVVSSVFAFIGACLAAALATAYHPTSWSELLWLSAGALAGFAAAFVYFTRRHAHQGAE